MKKRWKHQLGFGLIWGSLMTVFTLLYSIKEVSLQAQLASPIFCFKAIAHFLIGIFIIGYIGWKEISRQNPQ
ncbi:hypothetical protein [Flavobacterium sp.]|uniref:hypothetical protein n=1 Tax=Flavobacterium sp. TaxID=239 RepID=UPI0026288662|nr:hypothetical protein [Flavobacterium sp.]MDD2985754.1 hypothetical protein [Flavobacterium sp.]